MELETQTVIIKVTNDCNLNCRYCFVEKSAPRHRLIQPETIKRLLDELETHSPVPRVRLIWHGGEPMLAGIKFFQDALELQKKYQKEYLNCIQTNGILLTEDFAKFFKDNSVQIGLSIDGPKEINDSARVDKAGRGTFDRVLNNMLILKKLKISFGILATVSKYNVKDAKDLYAFCKEYEVPLKVSSLYPSGNAITNIDSLSISPDEYADFLIEMAEMWMSDSSPVEVDTLESILGNVLEHSKYPAACPFSSNCHVNFLAIGPTGDLYPCCLFQGFEDYKYGNIHQLSIADIPNTNVWKKLKRRVNYINEVCCDCSIKNYCNGGCPFNAFATYHTVNKRDYYCKAYRKAIPAILEITDNKVRGLRK
jgi:uncharacterized protein